MAEELPAGLEHVQFEGLHTEPGSDERVWAAYARSSGADCFYWTASFALGLYENKTWPEKSRFTIALLAIQMSALAHRWVRIGDSRYPCTPAWFRLFNSPTKLGQHLAVNFALASA